jgi:hypothetical protein
MTDDSERQTKSTLYNMQYAQSIVIIAPCGYGTHIVTDRVSTCDVHSRMDQYSDQDTDETYISSMYNVYIQYSRVCAEYELCSV